MNRVIQKGDGFSICREVRRQKPNQAIVMITAKGSEEDVITGFKAGADDYVCKPFSIRELMVRFTDLSLQVMDNGQKSEMVRAGAPVSAAGFMTQRTFPAPFDFLSAAGRADALPASSARRTLTAALMVLGIFLLLGLFAIYHSVRTVVDLSERRSQFVSSVTHELKTPLTNIRMYIEMLEQGIAATPEREQDYFHILGSESARLSRLINKVLELAKLEKKQRRFGLQPGNRRHRHRSCPGEEIYPGHGGTGPRVQ